MSDLQILFLVVAALAALPAWLTVSILKRHAKQDGETWSDWIPLSLLPYAIRRFKHRHKPAIVAGYVGGNLVFTAALIAFVVMRLSS